MRAVVGLLLFATLAQGQTVPSPALPADILPVVLEDYLGKAAIFPDVAAVFAQDSTSSVVAVWNVTNSVPADWFSLCSQTNYVAALGRIAARVAPVEFPNGIAIPDSASTNPVYEIGVENGALVTWVAHSLPHDPAVAESNRVAALTERSTLRHDLRVIKGVAQTNKAEVQAIVAWTNGMTAGQQRSDFNYLRRELIDANDTIIELTRLLRKLLKEQNP